tara:strand:- start:136 stop:729 length:594 start_codon:yes stop_codon:yes gene_type:complete
MRTVFDFLISPVDNNRYNNTKQVGEKELIINTEIYNHKYINREAEVISTPMAYKTPIKVGDTVVVHHNIFRRWHDMKGREKNSKSYYKENKYFANFDQIYLYKKDSEWTALDGWCFVQPLVNKDKFDIENEVPLQGVIKYSDGSVKLNQIIGFKPGHEHEFVIDGVKLYRIKSKFITIKYEYQGNEEEYNPSWAQSG